MSECRVEKLSGSRDSATSLPVGKIKNWEILPEAQAVRKEQGVFSAAPAPGKKGILLI